MSHAGRGFPDKQIAEVAGRQWGVVSLAELRACGLTDRAVEMRVASGRLHRLHEQVYAVGHASIPVEGAYLAAVLACGDDARLSHYAAGADWRQVKWDGRAIDVTVPDTAPHVHRGVVVHRSLKLGPEDVTTRRGIPITTPARTLVDLAGVLRGQALRRAVRETLVLGLGTIPEIVAAIDRAGRRHGTRALREILASGPAPTRSTLEDVVLDLIVAGGFEPPAVNAPLSVGGRIVMPDFRWPAHRLIVEADGGVHDHRLVREDDAERQAHLEAHGERVLRVTWAQAISRRAETITRLRTAGAPTRRLGE